MGEGRRRACHRQGDSPPEDRPTEHKWRGVALGESQGSESMGQGWDEDSLVPVSPPTSLQTGVLSISHSETSPSTLANNPPALPLFMSLLPKQVHGWSSSLSPPPPDLQVQTKIHLVPQRGPTSLILQVRTPKKGPSGYKMSRPRIKTRPRGLVSKAAALCNCGGGAVAFLCGALTPSQATSPSIRGGMDLLLHSDLRTFLA